MLFACALVLMRTWTYQRVKLDRFLKKTDGDSSNDEDDNLKKTEEDFD